MKVKKNIYMGYNGHQGCGIINLIHIYEDLASPEAK